MVGFSLGEPEMFTKGGDFIRFFLDAKRPLNGSNGKTVKP
jgi:hypothetical protein